MIIKLHFSSSVVRSIKLKRVGRAGHAQSMRGRDIRT